jgi:hypothetical protein
MFAVFLNMVTGAIADIKGVCSYHEIGGHGGGIGVIDRVALQFKEHLVSLLILPHSLEQGFGLLALLRAFLLRATAYQQEATE